MRGLVICFLLVAVLRCGDGGSRLVAGAPRTSTSGLVDGADDGGGVEGQVADAYAEGAVHRVGDRGGGGALGRLAGADRGGVAVDEVDVDERGLAEPQDRVGLPVVRGDAPPVEAHPLPGGPA